MFVYQFSETGVAHKLTGVANQDAQAVHVAGSDAFVFMADGMGGVRLGGEAASAAVQTASTIVPWVYLNEASVRQSSQMLAVKAAFPAASNALASAAVRNGWDPGEMLTTFMCAAYNEEDKLLTFGFCGDGGIIALTCAGEMRLLTRASKGTEQHQTTPLNCLEGWIFGSCANVRSFLVCTDGILDRLCPEGVVPRDGRLRKVLKRLLKMPARVEGEQLRLALDNALSSERPTFDDFGRLMDEVADDRTMVLVSGAVKRGSRMRSGGA